MSRALAVVTSAAMLLALALGCGYRSYETRLASTEKNEQYNITLNANLEPATTDDFQKLGFYVRPPKGLAKTKTFAPAQLTPGQYDLAATFQGPPPDPAAPSGIATGLQLHVLARKKTPKKTQQAKKEVEVAPEVPRGPFEADVRALLGAIYGEAATANEPKAATKRANSFRRLAFQAGGNNLIYNVHVYFYTQKVGQDEYDAALIWEIPVNRPNLAGTDPIDLTLESFAVANRANALFNSGGAVDLGGGIPGGPEGATPF